MIVAGPVKLPDNNPPQPFVRVFQNWNFTDYGDANFNWLHSEGLPGFFAGVGLPGNYGIGEPQILYDEPAGDPAGYGRLLSPGALADEALALKKRIDAIKDEAIRRRLKTAEGEAGRITLSPPGSQDRTERELLLKVLEITEAER